MFGFGKKKTKNDGWANVFTGLGYSGSDKRLNTVVSTSCKLTDQELAEIWRSEGLGKKAISIPVSDMVREWFEVEGDTTGAILSDLQEISAKSHISEALSWSRLFGGAIVIMGISDGGGLLDPVKEDRIQSVDWLTVYEKQYVTWITEDLYSDPLLPNYGKPEYYTVQNISTGEMFKVHETRTLRFDGALVPAEKRAENNGWGDSVMQAIYSRLRGLCDGLAGAESLITEFIIGVLKVPNLQQLLSHPGGKDAIKSRMSVLDMAKHIMNTLIMDTEEEFSRESASGVSGMDSLLSMLVDIFCSVSGVPRVKLIGDQSKGLGSEASGNIRMYYDDISFMQETDILPQIYRIVKYIGLAKQGSLKGVLPEQWAIKFNSLWQPTDEEEEKVRKLVAERDKIYMEMGLDPELILLNRFGGDTYSRETVLPDEYKEYLTLEATNINNNGGEDGADI